MKTITFSIITLLSYVALIATGVWAVVEFIIYLVKDIPFNWISLWSCIASIVICVIAGILSVYFSATEKASVREKKRSA